MPFSLTPKSATYLIIGCIFVVLINLALDREIWNISLDAILVALCIVLAWYVRREDRLGIYASKALEAEKKIKDSRFLIRGEDLPMLVFAVPKPSDIAIYENRDAAFDGILSHLTAYAHAHRASGNRSEAHRRIGALRSGDFKDYPLLAPEIQNPLTGKD